MARHFTVEENRIWHSEQPRKLMVSMVLYVDPDGRFLLVEPNYKPGVTLVGGVVDEGESPVAGAVRETKEEIGLDITPARLAFMGIKYNPPADGYSDTCFMLFTARLSQDELDAMVLQESELEGYLLATAEEARGMNISDMIRVALSLFENGVGCYNETQLIAKGYEAPGASA